MVATVSHVFCQLGRDIRNANSPATSTKQRSGSGDVPAACPVTLHANDDAVGGVVTVTTVWLVFLVPGPPQVNHKRRPAAERSPSSDGEEDR